MFSLKIAEVTLKVNEGPDSEMIVRDASKELDIQTPRTGEHYLVRVYGTLVKTNRIGMKYRP